MSLRMIMSKDLAVRINAVLENMVEEAMFSFTPDGLRIQAVDAAHIATVDLNIQKGAFDSFTVDADEEIGMDLKRFAEFLKVASSGDKISLGIDDANAKWVISTGNITRRFSTPATGDWPEVKLPNLSKLSARAVLPAYELHRIVKAASNITDTLTISADSGTLSMESNGDTDQVSMQLVKDALVSLECKEQARSIYPLDYVSNISKAIPAATLITMQLADDYPLKLDFAIAEGKGQVSYCLAPRIESD